MNNRSLRDNSCILETQIPGVPLWRRGKVRDVYDLGDKLLVVTTDRISAFDVILPTGIPEKGIILTQLSLFWFQFLKPLVPNHVITSNVAEFGPSWSSYSDQLIGRSMLVVKTQPFPFECVVRGYLAGSGWKEYQAKGSVCGISLPKGLRESDRLERPIFTPSTKAETGHDENIPFERMENALGIGRAAFLRDISLALYDAAHKHAEARGILLADTKFEFGEKEGQPIWIDEALTPDSSRFWPKDRYKPGMPQPSFDKQYIRDYLETLNWNKQSPAPSLPKDVVARTCVKYREAYERIMGGTLKSSMKESGTLTEKGESGL